MTTCIYKFEIPDLSRPIPNATEMSPSGELVPFHPALLDPERVIGRRIEEVTTRAGVYGMGGPGFFALRLGAEWLVVALWSAASWMRYHDRLIEDMFHDTADRPRPWISEGAGGDRLSPAIIGQSINGIDIGRDYMKLRLSGGFDLAIDADPSARPVFGGNRQPRTFTPDDDLSRAVFLSPTVELWI